jgi:hypothetical protein
MGIILQGEELERDIQMTKTPHLEYVTKHIAVKQLSVVWRKSQRQYDEAWAKKLATDFDPDKYEPVIVTKPNGADIYHIVEGQHRVGAVVINWGPETEIACHVIGEADPARAAEIWLGINQGRKKIRPVVEFLVAVEAKREIEVAVNAVVKKAGYIVSEYSKGNNVVTAVNALRKIYKIYGSVVLLHTLQTCRLLWASDPHGVRGAMVTGFGMFINEFQSQIEPAHLKKAILNQYKSPWKFLDAVKLEAEKSCETMDVAMSELVRMKYNKGLRDSAKRLKRKEQH